VEGQRPLFIVDNNKKSHTLGESLRKAFHQIEKAIESIKLAFKPKLERLEIQEQKILKKINKLRPDLRIKEVTNQPESNPEKIDQVKADLDLKQRNLVENLKEVQAQIISIRKTKDAVMSCDSKLNGIERTVNEAAKEIENSYKTDKPVPFTSHAPKTLSIMKEELHLLEIEMQKQMDQHPEWKAKLFLISEKIKRAELILEDHQLRLENDNLQLFKNESFDEKDIKIQNRRSEIHQKLIPTKEAISSIEIEMDQLAEEIAKNFSFNLENKSTQMILGSENTQKMPEIEEFIQTLKSWGTAPYSIHRIRNLKTVLVSISIVANNINAQNAKGEYPTIINSIVEVNKSNDVSNKLEKLDSLVNKYNKLQNEQSKKEESSKLVDKFQLPPEKLVGIYRIRQLIVKDVPRVLELVDIKFKKDRSEALAREAFNRIQPFEKKLVELMEVKYKNIFDKNSPNGDREASPLFQVLKTTLENVQKRQLHYLTTLEDFLTFKRASLISKLEGKQDQKEIDKINKEVKDVNHEIENLKLEKSQYKPALSKEQVFDQELKKIHDALRKMENRVDSSTGSNKHVVYQHAIEEIADLNNKLEKLIDMAEEVKGKEDVLDRTTDVVIAMAMDYLKHIELFKNKMKLISNLKGMQDQDLIDQTNKEIKRINNKLSKLAM
jgi:hypothetical protein